MLGSLVVPAAGHAAEVELPPVGVDYDYQLGGDRPVPDRVGILVRDRAAEPLEGVYDICYVNDFQTQPDERGFWRDKHWGLVLKDELDDLDGRRVLAVEYRRQDFRRACRNRSEEIAVVRRDLALSKKGTRRWC